MDVVSKRMGPAGDRGTVQRLALGALVLVVAAGIVVAVFRSGTDGPRRSVARSVTSSKAADAPPAAVGNGATADRMATDAAGSTGASGAGGAMSTAGSAAPIAPVPSVGTGPRIVRTADLSIRVKGSFAAALERATAVATTSGGFVTTSSTSSFEKGRSSGELTLRVPSDRFDEARRQLAGLGALESVSTGGEEVGGRLVDLDARLRTLQAEESALGTLLAKSNDIGQILQVRDRLTGVRTEIEQLAGEQAALKDQVALATIHVSLHEAAAKPTVAPAGHDRTGMAASLETAVDALLAVIGGMAIVLGASLPFLVLALVSWPLVRRYSRRDKRAAEAVSG
jgi:hypothetical protein